MGGGRIRKFYEEILTESFTRKFYQENSYGRWEGTEILTESFTRKFYQENSYGRWEGTRGGRVSKYDSIEAANAVNDDNWGSNVIINVGGGLI